MGATIGTKVVVAASVIWLGAGDLTKISVLKALAHPADVSHAHRLISLCRTHLFQFNLHRQIHQRGDLAKHREHGFHQVQARGAAHFLFRHRIVELESCPLILGRRIQ